MKKLLYRIVNINNIPLPTYCPSNPPPKTFGNFETIDQALNFIYDYCEVNGLELMDFEIHDLNGNPIPIQEI